jgi:NADP-dependent 3-hydroxy acid dehydrogenase YdfG
LTVFSINEDRPGVLITGCSSGIGEATAIRFSQEGYRVYATMRNPDGMSEPLKEALKGDEGHKVLALDVNDSVSIKRAIAEVQEESGRIDVLINNAGISSISSIEEIENEEVGRW